MCVCVCVCIRESQIIILKLIIIHPSIKKKAI